MADSEKTSRSPSLPVAIILISLFLSCFLVFSPVSAVCVWTGTWDTNWGRMIIDQKDETVIGTYEHDNGRFTGRIVGNMIIGTWSEAPGYNPPDNAGEFQLVISEDCRSFDGKWKYGSRAGAWDGEWYGHRIAGGAPQFTPQDTYRPVDTPQQLTTIPTPDITMPPTPAESFLSWILPVPTPLSSLAIVAALLAIFGFFAFRR